LDAATLRPDLETDLRIQIEQQEADVDVDAVGGEIGQVMEVEISA
jgi:hypothetical protein